MLCTCNRVQFQGETLFGLNLIDGESERERERERERAREAETESDVPALPVLEVVRRRYARPFLLGGKHILACKSRVKK